MLFQMTMQEKRVDWELLVSAQQKSGLSINAWCRNKKIKNGAFHYWKKLLVEKSIQQEPVKVWAELPIIEVPSIILSSSITLKIREFELELKPGFDQATLAEILLVVMRT